MEEWQREQIRKKDRGDGEERGHRGGIQTTVSGGRTLSLLLPFSFPCPPFLLLTSPPPPPPIISTSLACALETSLPSLHTQSGDTVPSAGVAIAPTAILMFNSLLGSQRGQQEIGKEGEERLPFLSFAALFPATIEKVR